MSTRERRRIVSQTSDPHTGNRGVRPLVESDSGVLRRFDPGRSEDASPVRQARGPDDDAIRARGTVLYDFDRAGISRYGNQLRRRPTSTRVQCSDLNPGSLFRPQPGSIV